MFRILVCLMLSVGFVAIGAGAWSEVEKVLVTYFEKDNAAYNREVVEITLEPNSKNAWASFKPLVGGAKAEGKSGGVAGSGSFIVKCEPGKFGKNACQLFLYDAKPGTYSSALDPILK